MLEIFALISNGTASIAHSVDTSGEFRCCVSLCPFGRMASAHVLLGPTPFCRMDTDVIFKGGSSSCRTSSGLAHRLECGSGFLRLNSFFATQPIPLTQKFGHAPTS